MDPVDTLLSLSLLSRTSGRDGPEWKGNDSRCEMLFKLSTVVIASAVFMYSFLARSESTDLARSTHLSLSGKHFGRQREREPCCGNIRDLIRHGLNTDIVGRSRLRNKSILKAPVCHVTNLGIHVFGALLSNFRSNSAGAASEGACDKRSFQTLCTIGTSLMSAGAQLEVAALGVETGVGSLRCLLVARGPHQPIKKAPPSAGP